MLRIQTIMPCILMALLLCNCKPKDAKLTPEIKPPLDSAKFVLELTMQEIQLNKASYHVYFYRDRFDEKKISYKNEESPYLIESPVTVVMKNSKNEIVYKETFTSENEQTNCMEYLLYSTISVNKTPKNIYLKFKYNDGSGAPNDWFNTYIITEINGKLQSKKLFTSGQLSLNAVNVNDNETILLNGIWDMDGTESRDSPHRYKIVKYATADNKIIATEMGTTKFKYTGSFYEKGADDILLDINLKEPNLLKGIKVNEFRDFNHSLN